MKSIKIFGCWGWGGVPPFDLPLDKMNTYCAHRTVIFQMFWNNLVFPTSGIVVFQFEYWLYVAGILGRIRLQLESYFLNKGDLSKI